MSGQLHALSLFHEEREPVPTGMKLFLVEIFRLSSTSSPFRCKYSPQPMFLIWDGRPLHSNTSSRRGDKTLN
jgi:hypothetical protein